ncbi:MAG: hypothetical protein IT237_02230 [Bacteroidia bacterium]|nr:hypothetical protein [Bacteroidia bacterium]
MTAEKQYEILDGLPAYGPMYIPISSKGESFYSEGFVVRFYKQDGSTWVANFSKGWTNFSKVFGFTKQNLVVVFANGTCYVMTPESETPKLSFGVTINNVLQTENGSLICSDDTNITILDNETGELWRSDRISWDGIKDLQIKNNTVVGVSYDPTVDGEEWSEFSIDLKTKILKGGSFQDMLVNNPNLQADKNGVVSEKTKRPWWKIF